MIISRKKYRPLLLLVAFSLARLAAGGPPTEKVLVGLADTEGLAGTRFESTVWVVNPSKIGVRVGIGLLPPTNMAPPAPVSRWLGPGETLVLRNALAELWGGRFPFGAITLDAPAPIDAVAVTANVAAAEGSYGLAIPAIPERDRLRLGETAVVPWVDEDAGSRTNLGVVLFGAENRVRVRVRSNEGHVLAEHTVAVRGSWQAGVASLASPPLRAAWAEFTVEKGEAVAWASVVDNRTGDGMLVPAVQVDDLPADLVHSGVARTFGVGGTSWRSDLRILNPGRDPATATIRLLGHPELEVITIAAGHAVARDDVLAGLGLPLGTAGALSIRADRPLVSHARTANSAPEGTFATGVPARRRWRDDLSAGRSGILLVDDDDEHRINVAMLGGLTGGSGELILRDSKGRERARQAFLVGSDVWTQAPVEAWLGGVKVRPLERLEVVVEGGSVACYAARIDQANGDTTLISPMASPLRVDGLDGRVIAGYQGWFSAPDDGSELDRWWHWFLAGVAGEDRWTVDLLPDLADFPPEERFRTTLEDGSGVPIELHSAWSRATVSRHFGWMAEVDLDGVFLQRFVVELDRPRERSFRDRVLENVTAGAEAHGRLFAVMYDIAGASGAGLGDRIWADWVSLVDRGAAASPAWVRHRGAPVVGIWGLAFDFTAATPADIASLIERFHSGPERYRATIVGGVPGGWRTLVGQADPHPEWPAVLETLDVLSPWHVGWSWDTGSHDVVWRGTASEDRVALAEMGVDYLPVVFPGFSWHNLAGGPSNGVRRDGGRFLWRQMANASEAGMIYVAMFDEVDEGTAIFKTIPSSARLPAGSNLIALDADGLRLPSDWYLRVAADGARMLRGQIPITRDLPGLPLGAEGGDTSPCCAVPPRR